MAEPNRERDSSRLEGKHTAVVLCWLLGNGCLFPWNSMLTMEDYYVYLFPILIGMGGLNPISLPKELLCEPAVTTVWLLHLRYHPTRVLSLVYQPFALITIAILACNEANINTRKRNLSGYILFSVCSIAVLVLDLATSGKGGLGPYIGICIIAATFGIADAHVQGGMVGDLSFMLPELVQSFLAGLAASGALTSTLRIITRAVFESSKNGLRKGAILFFAIAAFFEILCVFLYAWVFPKLPVVKYYRAKAAAQGSKTVSADLAAGGIREPTEIAIEDVGQTNRLKNRQLLVLNFDYAFGIFTTYWLSLSIFPGFLAEDTGKHDLGTWYPLVLIATFNMSDLFGRCLPMLRFLKLKSRKGLALAVASRVVFIPCFFYTAKYGDQGWMIMLTSFLGISHGYLTVCIMTSAVKGYTGPEQNALGNILVLFLLGGIFAGVTADWLWLIGTGW